MTDIVFIRNFPVQAIIGIYDWERTAPQTLILDLEMVFDCTKASQSDDIAHALDYKQVHDDVKTLVENSQFFLIEKLACQIMTLILEKYTAVHSVKLSLNKKGAVGCDIDVGVRMMRSRFE